MRWRILRKIRSEKSSLRQKEILRALFLNRGLKTKEQREDFLNPKSPYQLTAQEVEISSVQLKKAVKRIRGAVKKKEKIVVYGDYDADGLCATAIVWEALHRLKASVMPFIPSREEGYGLKTARIDQLAKEGVKLIITVDQGIVQSKQVAHARKIGLDVIVTDHHTLGKKKPAALAIVHTTQLSGSGVAWFLARQFWPKLNLSLATIGTLTDMMPLLGPNRSLVKFGLEHLKKTKRPGLLAIYRLSRLDQKKIGPYEVGFLIGPRLNASGRMKDPLDSLRLICTSSKSRAKELAEKINQQNRERQLLTEEAALKARQLWLDQPVQGEVIFVRHQSFEHGVIGLVARKLVVEFQKPAIVLAPRQDHWVASARSIPEFNVVEAIRECRELIGAHGGHPLAAGFSVMEENLEALEEKLLNLARDQLASKKRLPTLKIDVEVKLSDLNFSLLKKLEKLAPFGQANQQPVLATRGVKVVGVRLLGQDQKHLKLAVVDQQLPAPLEAIGFNMAGFYSQLSLEKPIDLAYQFELNEWNGQKKLQLKLEDIKVNKE